MEDKKDIEIICDGCGEPFIFSARDQEFYEENKYVPPKRCRKCRLVRKKEREKYNQV